MTVDAAEVVLFSVAGHSVSFVISCTESSESAPLESSRIFPTSTKSGGHFLSDYSRNVPNSFRLF